jgi:hypothetical protein
MGPGSSGTSFLWYMFRGLGFDTGKHVEFFRAERPNLFKENIEIHIPHVLKGTGGLCKNTFKYIDENHLEIEHIFFALRNFENTVRGRKKMSRNRGGYKRLSEEQLDERIKYEIPHTIGNGLLNLIERDYPFTIVKFPESALDAEYCYNKLKVVLGDMSFENFKEAHAKVANPEKIHHG